MSDLDTPVIDEARSHEPKVLASGFAWPECPRWHDGRMWFTDMYAGTLKTVDSSGNTEIVVDCSSRAAEAGVPIALGGFGWLPDGRLVVASMFERVLLVKNGSGSEPLSVYVDLTDIAPFPINDVVVSAEGHAYVTQLGFDYFSGQDPMPSPIILVEPDGVAGTSRSGAPLLGANGIAISSDGRRLYTAEAFANRIAVFDRAEDGSLSNNRVFAECPSLPDGIGLDDDGGVWAAMPGSGFVSRFVDGGAVTDTVPVPLQEGLGSACLLGGPDRTTLYITVGGDVEDMAKAAHEAAGSIWYVDVGHSGGRTRP